MSVKLLIPLLCLLAVIAGCVESSKPVSENEIELQQMSDIERGRHAIKIMGCNDCHTPGYMLTRAKIPEEGWLIGGSLGFRGYFGTVYPTNLRLLLNGMAEEDWLILARQMRKDSPMDWVMLPKTAEQDLRAIYRFVKYLGPKGVPAPASLPVGVPPTTQYVEYPDPH